MKSKPGIMDMLTYKREHLSSSEAEWVRRYIDIVPGMQKDKHGNRYITIGDALPDVMFSAHVDTVHKGSGRQPILRSGNIVTVGRNSNCLGADDGAGCWLLLQMINERVPGIYVFHRGEERGGIGSSAIAKDAPAWLDTVRACIAFDRRGTKDVIIEQRCGETASRAFAESIASMLQMGHKPSTFGSFTDTANYADMVPECTNISIGYDNEHRTSESLDLAYLYNLRDAVLDCWDADKLEIVRKPGDFGKPPVKTYYGGKSALPSKKTYIVPAMWNRADAEAEDVAALFADDDMQDVDADAFELPINTDLVWAVQEYPEVVAQLLEESGITAADVEALAFHKLTNEG